MIDVTFCWPSGERKVYSLFDSSLHGVMNSERERLSNYFVNIKDFTALDSLSVASLARVNKRLAGLPGYLGYRKD